MIKNIKKDNPIDNAVYKIVNDIIEDNENNFTENNFDSLLNMMKDSIELSNNEFEKGLHHLIERGSFEINNIASNILENFKNPEKVKEIIKTKIHDNPEIAEVFFYCVNDFYDCGDFDIENSLITVILTLFPLHPTPYIYLGTLIWRRNGLHKAEKYYNIIITMFDDPTLNYFAADCFSRAGDKNKAYDILESAKNNLLGNDNMSNLLDEIINAQKRL